MNYSDAVYGPVSIEEPVLLDLINSQAVGRLAHILQHGITGFLGITQSITRFDHSVGVMLLSRRFGASQQEQIAALLHDVSHTAFSHVFDHVFEGQSYHERMKGAYLEQSDLPPILSRYGYDWRDFIDEEAYPILEQPAPALCADRLDYFFRDGLALGLLTTAEVAQALPHLCVVDNQLGVDELKTAQWLAYTYMQADERSWSNVQALGLYELMAELIKIGFRVGAIRESDVWLTDQGFWTKLTSCPDETLQAQLAQLGRPIHFVEAKSAPWRSLTPKVRTINPTIFIKGKGLLLSDLDAGYKHDLIAYYQRRQGVLSIAIAD